VTPGRVERLVRDPLEWGLERCRPEDLAGGDAEHNAARLRAVFSGEEAGAHRDALILGAALVLELTGKAQDPAEAVSLAVEALDSGKATELLDAIARFAGSEGRR
jgi:anthranilate phosphoribosyltransferase